MPTDFRWRANGLFSDHFLSQRLPGSGAWPDAAQSDRAFDEILALYNKNAVGLRKANEEECEKRFIGPVLTILGFGHNNRKPMPNIDSTKLPDYLLYPDQDIADALFEKGDPAGYYEPCLAILEAKRWGHNLSEDASGKGKAPKGRSPHYQIRDYLSESERLSWGILTNGSEWRLYCKRDRASSFFEFDLGTVLAQAADEQAAQAARQAFRFFYALFRRASFDRRPDGSCPLNDVRAESVRYKEEIERDLRSQVFDCVELLGEGFLVSPYNDVTEADLPAIYDNALILLFRILFVLNAESRGLLPTSATNERAGRYYASYGLEYIRAKLADPHTALEYADRSQTTLYARMRGLWMLINGAPVAPGKHGPNADLDSPRYNGGLFAPDRHQFLEKYKVGDRYLAETLRLLCHRKSASGEWVTFDYAGLGERHLGSIYEGLLEHHFELVEGKPKLANDRGERKAFGAYYTPQDFVTYIVESTLRPLLDAANEETTEEEEDGFGERVLALKVCDPAMGSGHFLVEAVSVLAEAVAAHPSTAARPTLNSDGTPRQKNDGSGEPLMTQEARLAYWKRRVVESCIYGVDLNPLAVELAKLSLWLKTVDRVPLNFLDHHLRVGNSLIGTTLDALSGYPDPGRRTNGVGKSTAQLSMTFSQDLQDALAKAIAEIGAIEGVPTDSRDAAKEKERLWKDVSENLMPRFRDVGDLWLAPWFTGTRNWIRYMNAIEHADIAHAARSECAAELDPLRPFHWELEFPDIFMREDGTRNPAAGFDAVVTNPPWERIKLQENEFFAGRSHEVAHAPKASDRKRLIGELRKSRPELWSEYEKARDRADNTLAFGRLSGFFPLMGKGDTNYYALFAERALQLLNPTGRMGILVPSGIATDETTSAYFRHLVDNRMLVELLDFENRRKPFKDVDSRFKFSVVRVVGAGAPQETVRCAFFLHEMQQATDPERLSELSQDDFRLFNPNTRTCPIFRRRRDADLTRRIYEAAPVLIDRSDPSAERNPWGVSFLRMFDMTNDSGLFRTAKELVEEGLYLVEGNVYKKGPEEYLPLYEGKMVQMYDHRAASVVVNPENLFRPAVPEPTGPAEHAEPAFAAVSQFWVSADAILKRSSNVMPPWQLGFKEITSPTNARTIISSALPSVGCGNKIPLVCFGSDSLRHSGAALLANLNSFALDFAARQKIGGQTLNYFIVEQLPILPPERYDEVRGGVKIADFVKQRVLELTYTAHDIKGFAEDMGFDGPPFPWDAERRLHLRCQLDALYFRLYGLTRDEAGEILDTFPIVQREDRRAFGRFRTKDLILSYCNAYAAADMDAWIKG